MVWAFHRERTFFGLMQNAVFEEFREIRKFLKRSEIQGLGFTGLFFRKTQGCFGFPSGPISVKSVGEPVFCKKKEDDYKSEPMEEFTI